MRRAVLLTAALVMPVFVHAQWLKHPTPGIPRAADGTLKADAPAPRGRDGKPDFSGVWVAEKTRQCPAEGCDDMQISYQFLDIGWRVPGGLPYRPWALALMKKRTAERRKDDPQAHCLPTGIIRMHTDPLYRKVIQTSGLLVILNERNAMSRQIFTDSRPLPVDPNPSWVGYSSGAWEGDTLVVKTAGFRDGIWLDAAGSPLTDAGTITERFRRVNVGTLEIRITVDDPKAYTAPWSTTLNQLLEPDTDLVDYICAENERSRRHFVVK